MPRPRVEGNVISPHVVQFSPAEVVTPCTIQGVECAVLVSQPILELGKTSLAVAFVAAELIVCLPPDNIGRGSKVLGHRTRDPF